MPRYRAALRRGVAAAVEHEDFDLAMSTRTVVDVGANRGQFAVFALERLPQATIHCFEPGPAASSALRRLLGAFHDGARVHIYEVALGRCAEPRVLHRTADDDASSLHTAAHRQRERGTREVERVNVTTRRLDDVLPPSELVRPVLLKVDVQGSELAVLEGAGELLDAIDEVIVECSFAEFYVGQDAAADIVALLRARKFTLDALRPSITERGLVLQADLLFRRVVPS